MRAARLSTASCGLLSLSTHIWSRVHGAVHAYLVAAVRIFGRAPNKEPVFTSIYRSCSRSCAFWGQPCGLPPFRLAPTTNSLLKKGGETMNTALCTLLPLMCRSALAQTTPQPSSQGEP